MERTTVALQGTASNQSGEVMFEELSICLLDIELPIDLKNGNDGQGHGWQRSAGKRSRFSKLAEIPERKQFEVPTFVVVTRILGPKQRMMDFDNGLRGDWKQLQDTLVEKGWWYDDSHEHITGVLFRQDDSRRDRGPACRVSVWESGRRAVSKVNRRINKNRKGGRKPSSSKTR